MFYFAQMGHQTVIQIPFLQQMSTARCIKTLQHLTPRFPPIRCLEEGMQSKTRGGGSGGRLTVVEVVAGVVGGEGTRRVLVRTAAGAQRRVRQRRRGRQPRRRQVQRPHCALHTYPAFMRQLPLTIAPLPCS